MTLILSSPKIEITDVAMTERSKNKKRLENIFTVFIAVVVIIIGIKHRKEGRVFNDNLIKDASYAIGEVVYYQSRKRSVIIPKVASSTGRDPAIKYKFNLNGATISNSYDSFEGRVPEAGIKIGDKYLVLFLKDEPSKSRMFFDYPIKDSIDFNRYVKEFEKTRKYRIGGGGFKSQQKNSEALSFHIRIDSTFLASYTVDSLPQVKDVKPIKYGGVESVYGIVKKVAEYYEYRKFNVNDKVIGRILLVNIPMNLDGELKLVVLASYDKSGNPIDAIRLGKLEQVSDVYYLETASIANNEVVRNIHFDGYDAEAGDFVTRYTSEKYTIQENGIIKKE